MTIQQIDTSQSPTPLLATLHASEIDTLRDVLASAGQVTATARFAYVGLQEPHKRDVLAWQAGNGPRPPRVARIIMLDIATGLGTDYRVDVESAVLLSSTAIDPDKGQAPIIVEEYEIPGQVLATEPQWIEALAKRGLTPGQVVAVPLSAGTYNLPGEEGRRMIRVFAFHQEHPLDQPLAHPVDGLCAYVDLTTREMTELIDHRVYPVPQESANYDDPHHKRPPLEGLKPIEIIQPEGPSFTVRGEHVEWANWSLDVGYDLREGLLLRQLSYNDQGVKRPVMYRASVAEMVVPYADPQPTRYWQNYFDAGEYIFGRFANQLALGCDCLGEIHYFDATVADSFGQPQTLKNVICMHEEDFGILWKHTDMWTGSQETRRQRRLVISFFTTVGNYDYGFYWYLYLDGTIECEAKLTGIPFPTSFPPEGSAFQNELIPGLGAPYHQHLFNVRLDMTVDGVSNAVEEVQAKRLPISGLNPHGNAFSCETTRLRSEKEGNRDYNAALGRVWHIINTEKTNRVGKPTGYVLQSAESPMLLADPSSSIAQRAAFTTKPLWVTQYAPHEQYPSGDMVNQSAFGSGLPEYSAGDRSLDGEDLVLWHTFGVTHFPRSEEWPIMPVDYARFTLKPYNFFDTCPVMNVPRPTPRHCAGGAKGGCHD
ncbi:primary-amine oxidase [Pseudomonas sp. dw_358]|uniref:primary-amine oxidase n=1 Tax=Pseudomonas sp. dw_358 TaxID=2720083 RepID=UPI001BD65549|nr:primary-amine oxidase [Pseudomonas sp. dw_358]